MSSAMIKNNKKNETYKKRLDEGYSAQFFNNREN